jgi:hypothetical protein
MDLLPKAGSAHFTPSYSRINREIFLLETEIHLIISDRNTSKKEKKKSISSCIGLLSQFMDSLYEFKETLNSWSGKIDNLIYNLKYK